MLVLSLAGILQSLVNLIARHPMNSIGYFTHLLILPPLHSTRDDDLRRSTEPAFIDGSNTLVHGSCYIPCLIHGTLNSLPSLQAGEPNLSSSTCLSWVPIGGA